MFTIEIGSYRREDQSSIIDARVASVEPNFKTLGDLEKKELSIYVTRPLVEWISGIYVFANDYMVAGQTSDVFVLLDHGPLDPWPEPLTEEEQAVPWVVVLLRISDPPAWMPRELARTGWNLDFSQYTPPKNS